MKFFHPLRWACYLCAHTGYVGITIWHKYGYYVGRKRWPNFRHPKDLAERLLAAESKPSFTKYAPLVDKVKVRDYIISKGLGDTLLPIYGVWKDAREIDFSKLPDKFALKPNNGSGGHYFCKDKSSINKEQVVKQLNDALKIVDTDIAFRFERQYSKIEPRIYCEELMDMGSDKWPVDYKFTCVHGRICDIFVATERETGKTKYCTLNTDWEILPYTKTEFLPTKIPAKPKHLDRMIEIAKTLSSDFEFVRVDLYEYNDKVYFSELTFSPWGGYMHSYNDEGIRIIGNEFDKH